MTDLNQKTNPEGANRHCSESSGSRKYYGFEQHYIEVHPDVVIVSYEVIKENH